MLDKSSKNFEPIIHSINKLGKKKSINTHRYDWVKQASFQQNQNVDQLVRISFTNKTALFKRKRITSFQNGHRGMLAPLQTHIARKNIILNQSPRSQTEPSISEMRGCKSYLNPKQQSRKSLADLG